MHSQAKPRLHRAILRWGRMAQLFYGDRMGGKPHYPCPRKGVILDP